MKESRQNDREVKSTRFSDCRHQRVKIGSLKKYRKKH